MDIPRDVAGLFSKSYLLEELKQQIERHGIDLDPYIIVLRNEAVMKKKSVPYYSSLFIAYPDANGDKYIHKIMAPYTTTYVALLEKRLENEVKKYLGYAKEEATTIAKIYKKLKSKNYDDKNVRNTIKLLRMARNILDTSVYGTPLTKEVTVTNKRKQEEYIILYIQESSLLSILITQPSPHLKDEWARATLRVYKWFKEAYEEDKRRRSKKGLIARLLRR